MTDEDRQRQMDFIVAQQAKFTTDIQQLLEAQAASDKRIDALERGFVSLFNFIQDVAKNQRENNTQIASLIEAQKHTDERLNALILVVERSISRENGSVLRTASKKTTAKKSAAKKNQSRK